MCGRYTLHALPADVSARFSLAKSWFTLTPRFNIAPTQSIAAIIQTEEGRVLTGCRWGLIPSWTKAEDTSRPLINARAETLTTRPTFRQAFRHRRCLIPADGFFEWTGPAKKREPVYVQLKNNGLFGFAGIWDEWHSPGKELLKTCAIITVEPNELMKPIHNRMPAILAPDQEAAWLDPATTTGTLIPLLHPYPSQEMQSVRVSPRVNSPSFDSPLCIEPQPPPPSQSCLF